MASVPGHHSNSRIVSLVWRERMEVVRLGLQHTDPLKTFLNTTYTYTCPGSGIDKIPFTVGRDYNSVFRKLNLESLDVLWG